VNVESEFEPLYIVPKGKKKIVKEIKAEVEELIAGVGSLTKTVNR